MRSLAVSLPQTLSAGLPRASVLDTVGLFLQVFLPTISKGIIMRRPAALAMAEALNLDARAVRAMQRLRAVYGSGPVPLSIPGRSIAVLLDPADAHRVLAETPDPFSTRTPEKASVLAHFEPKVSLNSEGTERTIRRRFNDYALDSTSPRHHMSEHFIAVLRDEFRRLFPRVHRQRDVLDWGAFSDSWFRMVRRILFGEAAADDNELSRIMASLRRAANWGFLFPRQKGLRERLFARIRDYLVQAEPNSLASYIARMPADLRPDSEQQVPQWLFAFDAAGMATFRALALLTAQPETARPDLRATLLESVRLWPTSPLILREAKTATTWEQGELPANTAMVIFTPFFHRDDERLPYADRFAPALWSSENGEPKDPRVALVPFSAGSGFCPGRNLVLLLGSSFLAELTSCAEVTSLSNVDLGAENPLPGTLNHFRLRFRLA